MSVAREINEAIYDVLSIVGGEISEIINQDGDDKTDGEVIDEIVELLEKYKIYKVRI